MTTDEAIARIPTGYLLRLIQWKDSFENTGWGAILMDYEGAPRASGEADTPADAIMAAIAEIDH